MSGIKETGRQKDIRFSRMYKVCKKVMSVL